MTMWTPLVDNATTRYLAIANALEEDIRQGRLKPGDVLPTHRELAEVMGVTVGTVTRGYGEAARRGLVRGETGRGTFVAGEPGLVGALEVRGGDLIEMGLNLPFEAFSPDLSSTLAQISRRSNLQALLRYQRPEGLPEHREAGAVWVRRHGLEVNRDQVLVTAGAQHAMLVALSTLFRSGDRIGVEELTYPTLKALARQLELRLVPVAVDDKGIIPESLETACHRQGLRGLYIQTGCNNPTTATLSESRRQAVVDLSRRFDLMLVEDESYGATVDHGLPPLAARMPERCAFIASTSKMLCGGLRVGFLVGPDGWYGRLRRGIMASTWMAAPLMAEIASTWIMDGTAEKVLAAKTSEAEARNLLAQEYLHSASFLSRPTGHFIWVILPEPWRGVELAEEAMERGVVITPAEHFAFGHACPVQAVRISLSGPGSWLALRKGLRIIEDILSVGPGASAPIL